jgi:hypothetical protein
MLIYFSLENISAGFIMQLHYSEFLGTTKHDTKPPDDDDFLLLESAEVWLFCALSYYHTSISHQQHITSYHIPHLPS